MSSSHFDKVKPSKARLRPSKCPDPCAVCGDLSSGHHYDVPSCHGCKIFFRRTIIANRKFECKRGGKCLLKKDVRCACKACRFQRCVEVGMNPKAIHYSSAPVGVAKERKLKKSALVSDAPPMNEQPELQSPSQPSITTSPTDSADSSSDSMVKQLMDIELKCEYLRTSNFPAGNSLLDLLTQPCALDDINKYRTLTSWKEETPMKRIKYWYGLDLTIVVEYAKSFDIFRRLSLTDKCALLQQVSMVCCAVVNYWNSVRNGHDCVVFPCGFIPSKELPYVPARPRTTNSRLTQAFQRHDFDRTEYILLKAILFFHSDCSELSEDGKKKVEAERQKCSEALFNYMCAKYGLAGPGKFGMILALLPTMQDAVEQIKDRCRFGAFFRPEDIEPFLEEMMIGKKISF